MHTVTVNHLALSNKQLLVFTKVQYYQTSGHRYKYIISAT